MTTEAHSSDLDTTDLFLGNVLGAFALGMSDKMDEAVCGATSLSSSSCYAIVQIGTEIDCSIEELRRMLALEHSSVVRLLDKLERNNLVQRLRGLGSDKRQVTLRLTEEGEKLFVKILDARQAVIDRTLAPLDAAEKSALTKALEKMMPQVVMPGDDQHYICRLCDLEVCPQGNCPVNLAHPGYEEFPAQAYRNAARLKHR